MGRERAQKLLNFYLEVRTFFKFKDDHRLFELGASSRCEKLARKYDAFMACRYELDSRIPYKAADMLSAILVSEDVNCLSKWSRANSWMSMSDLRGIVIDSVSDKTGLGGLA